MAHSMAYVSPEGTGLGLGQRTSSQGPRIQMLAVIGMGSWALGYKQNSQVRAGRTLRWWEL